MKKTISASDLRSQIRRVLDEVGYGQAHYVVEKFGEPAAAIVSMEDYRLLDAARAHRAVESTQEEGVAPVERDQGPENSKPNARVREQELEDGKPDMQVKEARADFYARTQLSDVATEFGLGSEQYQQLARVARAQQRSVLEVVQGVLAGWLAQEPEMQRARRLMRELGNGLGQGPPDQSVARDHDTYLYTREPT